MLFQFYLTLMSARLFHSTADLDGLSEALIQDADGPPDH